MSNKIILCLKMIVSIVCLTGCVAVWGGSYKIDSRSEDHISIHYDTTFIDMKDIQLVADKHCANYNKNAVVEKKSKSPWGLSTATFACKTPYSPE